MSDSRRDADDLQTFGSTPMQPGTADKQNTIAVVGAPDALASLFKKLAKVQRHFKKLQHSGHYKQGSTEYTYATEADVVEPISQKLAAEGITLIPSVVASWWHDIPSKYNINRVCTVHAQVLIADTDTGAYVIASTFSTAANGDKATNAAFTTAVKYFMAKLVGVSFGDDADEYSADGEKVGKDTKPRERAASTDAKDKLVADIKAAGEEKAAKVKAHMKKKKYSMGKMTESQLAELRAMLEAK